MTGPKRFDYVVISIATDETGVTVITHIPRNACFPAHIAITNSPMTYKSQ